MHRFFAPCLFALSSALCGSALAQQPPRPAQGLVAPLPQGSGGSGAPVAVPPLAPGVGDAGAVLGLDAPLVGADASYLPPEIQRELMLTASQVLNAITRDTIQSFDVMRASAARQGHNLAPAEPVSLEERAYLESQLGHIGFYSKYLDVMTQAAEANEKFRAQQHLARLSELQRVAENRKVLAATQQSFDLADQDAWSVIRLPESIEMHGLSGRVSIALIGSSTSVSVRRVELSFPAGVVLEPPPDLASDGTMDAPDAGAGEEGEEGEEGDDPRGLPHGGTGSIVDSVTRVAERPHVWISDQGCEESLILGPGDGCTIVIDWYLPDGRATPTGQLVVDAVSQASGAESILQTHTSLLHAGGRTVEAAARVDQVLLEHGAALRRLGDVLDSVSGQLQAGHFTAPIVDRVTALEDILADGQHLQDIRGRLTQVAEVLEGQSETIFHLTEQASAADAVFNERFDAMSETLFALDARIAEGERAALEYRAETDKRIDAFRAEVAALPDAVNLHLREVEGFIDIDQIEMVVADAVSQRATLPIAGAQSELALPGLDEPALSVGPLHTRARVLTVADGAATVEYQSIGGVLRRLRVSPGDPLHEGWIVEEVDPLVPSVLITHHVTGAEAVLYRKDSGRLEPPPGTRLAHAFSVPAPAPLDHGHSSLDAALGGGVGLSASRVERPSNP